MSNVAIRLPLGVRDFLPRAAARRRRIAETLIEAFESWGYARVITPLFECADVLERGLGADARATAIRFVEPGTGEVVALRPDFTPQVARIAATRMAEVDGPLRFSYAGAVTRMGTRASAQREILQAGVELIGVAAPDGDAEAIAVAAHALALMGLPHTRLDIGHVAPARHALASIADPDLRQRMTELLGKKDRSGVMRMAAALPIPTRTLLAALPRLWGTPARVLDQARALPWPDPVHAALGTLAAMLDRLKDELSAELLAHITMDLGEVRAFDYYTGMRFAGYAEGVGEAVLVGGRYDHLVGRYGREAHATGFAVDIEAMAQAQRAAGVAVVPVRQAVLVSASLERRGDASRLAANLRAHGLRAAVDLGAQRGRDALVAYARALGFVRVIVLGPGDASLLLAVERDRGVEPDSLPEHAVSAALAGQVDDLHRALRMDTPGLDTPAPAKREEDRCQ